MNWSWHWCAPWQSYSVGFLAQGTCTKSSRIIWGEAMSKEVTVVQSSKVEVVELKPVVKKLEEMIDKVTEKECTPETVAAAVSCVDSIVDIYRLCIEVERLNRK